MKESLEIEVIIDGDKNTHILKVEYHGDVVNFLLDGKPVFGCDWSHNFARLAKRGLDLWGMPIRE